MGKWFRLQQAQRRAVERKLQIATVFFMWCTSVTKMMTLYVLWQKSKDNFTDVNATNVST